MPYKLILVFFTFLVLCSNTVYSRDVYFSNPTDTVTDPLSDDVGGSAQNKCLNKFAENRWFTWCPNLKFDTGNKYFSDLETLPGIGDKQAIKLGLVRHTINLGDSISLPFSIVVADIAGTSNEDEINKLKLLDPDLGNINIRLSYLGKYHSKGFCNFSKTSSGGCYAGINFGMKYIQPAGENDDIFGAHVGISNSFIFPIFNEESSLAGNAILNFSANYFNTNGAGSDLFNDVDSPAEEGASIAFKDDFWGYAASFSFNITDSFSLKASYFDAPDHDSLDSQTVFSFGWDFAK